MMRLGKDIGLVAVVAVLLAAGVALAKDDPPEAPVGSIVGDTRLAPVTGISSNGRGVARVIINQATGNHTCYLSLSGDMDFVTMAHIHTANKTSNGPVRLGIVPALASPPTQLAPPLSYDGDVNWTLFFTSANLQTWFTTATSPADALAQFLDLLDKDLLYVNVHTTKNPGGEIRGQLVCRNRCNPLTKPLD